MLRGRPRPAVRFRRGLIVGMTAAAAASLIIVSWLALEPPSFHRTAASPNEDALEANGAAEALANVPDDYGRVPRLGPPLPGDLGRPILAHERGLSGPEPIGPGNALGEQQERRTALDDERQRIAAARRAARSSPLLVQVESGNGAPAGSPPQGLASADARTGSAAPASIEQGKADVAPPADAELDRHSSRRAPPPWTLSAGTIIPASLITGLNSDLPGVVIAQVTENVRDSASGRTILIPQGAKLIGSYDTALPTDNAGRCWPGTASSFRMDPRSASTRCRRPMLRVIRGLKTGSIPIPGCWSRASPSRHSSVLEPSQPRELEKRFGSRGPRICPAECSRRWRATHRAQSRCQADDHGASRLAGSRDYQRRPGPSAMDGMMWQLKLTTDRSK